MNAIVLTKYGTPADLELRAVAKPTPRDHEVLIRVHASAVNDWDWALLTGQPFFMRAFIGVLRPKLPIMGCEVAGRIEAVGAKVRTLHPGDDVYGDLSESGFGGFADFVCAPEQSVVRAPRNLSYEQAAAIPHAAMLAHQSLHDIAHISEGQQLLINGAGGGVGTLGVQIAKRHGIEVTGVDSTSKQDFLLSVGFDHAIDYTQDDFTQTGRRYDVILDTRSTRSPCACVRALRPGGTYVTVGGSTPRLLQCVAFSRWIAATRKKRVRVLALKPNHGLAGMTDLIETGTVVPVIDTVFPLADVPQAIRRFGEACHHGKIIISMERS